MDALRDHFVANLDASLCAYTTAKCVWNSIETRIRSKRRQKLQAMMRSFVRCALQCYRIEWGRWNGIIKMNAVHRVLRITYGITTQLIQKSQFDVNSNKFSFSLDVIHFAGIYFARVLLHKVCHVINEQRFISFFAFLFLFILNIRRQWTRQWMYYITMYSTNCWFCFSIPLGQFIFARLSFADQYVGISNNEIKSNTNIV